MLQRHRRLLHITAPQAPITYCSAESAALLVAMKHNTATNSLLHAYVALLHITRLSKGDIADGIALLSQVLVFEFYGQNIIYQIQLFQLSPRCPKTLLYI